MKKPQPKQPQNKIRVVVFVEPDVYETIRADAGDAPGAISREIARRAGMPPAMGQLPARHSAAWARLDQLVTEEGHWMPASNATAWMAYKVALDNIYEKMKAGQADEPWSLAQEDVKPEALGKVLATLALKPAS